MMRIWWLGEIKLSADLGWIPDIIKLKNQANNIWEKKT
jgi:hypothetical protein